MSIENLIGQSLGPYELRELLGVGGMGAVYRAVQTTLKREVAIKVLPSHLAQQPGYMERFTREAKVAAALEHPHIVPIYDYGTQRDISYVVMRWLSGGSLAERLREAMATGKLPSVGEVSELLRQLAGALDYAHSRGVIHRDIKPSNVMFDNHGTAYLVDFGIAKLLDATSALTGTGQALGTPSYMPPEQWRDEPITAAADQYALAVLIYSMLTGHLPFEASTPFALMHKHLNEPPTPPQAWRADLPLAATTVLERALAKQPTDRFPTVTAFAQAFDAATEGIKGETTGFFHTRPTPPLRDLSASTVLVTPTPMRQREGKRRSPMLLVAGLAALVLVGAAAFLLLRPNLLPPGAGGSTPTEVAALATGTDTEAPPEPGGLAGEDTETSTPPEPSATPTTAPTATEASATPEPTTTPSVEPSETATDEAATAVIAMVGSDTPEPTATERPTDTEAPTATPEPTATQTPTPEPTATHTPSPEPTATWTASPEPTATRTPTPEPTDTPQPSATPTPIPSPTPTPSPTLTPSPVPTTALAPTATRAAICRVVNGSAEPVNVLSGPGPGATTVGSLMPGTPADVVSLEISGDQVMYRIIADVGDTTLEGWIASTLLQEVTDCPAISFGVVTRTATPTPTATEAVTRTPIPSPVPVTSLSLQFDAVPVGTGWSMPETAANGLTYIWMNAPRATLFYALEPNTGYSVKFRILGEIVPGLMDSLALLVNGVPVPLTYREDATGARIYDAYIPAELLTEGRTLLTFVIDRVVSPQSLGESDDRRTLGLTFDWVRIDQQAAPPATPMPPLPTPTVAPTPIPTVAPTPEVVGRLIYGASVTGTLEQAPESWTLDATAGDQVLLSLASAEVDVVMDLFSPDGTLLATSDDDGGSTNAFIAAELPETARYTVTARSYLPDESGSYTLLAMRRPPKPIDVLSPQLIMTTLVESGVVASGGELAAEIDSQIIDLTSKDDTVIRVLLEGEYTDFVMSAAIYWGPGSRSDTCGFTFRENNAPDYYLVEIDQNQTLWFIEFSGGEWQEPQQSTQSAIRTGPDGLNHLLLIAQGGEFTVLINSQAYQRWSNTTLAAGRVGLEATTFTDSEETRCIFTDVWVWALP